MKNFCITVNALPAFIEKRKKEVNYFLPFNYSDKKDIS